MPSKSSKKPCNATATCRSRGSAPLAAAVAFSFASAWGATVFASSEILPPVALGPSAELELVSFVEVGEKVGTKVGAGGSKALSVKGGPSASTSSANGTIAEGQSAALLGGQPVQPVRLNEIRIGGVAFPGCSGGSVAYIELTGPPGTPMGEFWVLRIGAGPTGTNPGTVEQMIRFQPGAQIPEDGCFLTVGSVFCPNLGASINQTLPFNLVGDVDNITYLLVRNFTGDVNLDLDANDDCIVDRTPWNGVLDGVAFRYAGNDDCVYDQFTDVFNNPLVRVFEPDPVTGLPPLHVFRCTPSDVWIPGSDLVATYEPGIPGAFDTAGTPNPACEDVVCPSVGECCEPHLGLGCEDQSCCQTVCSIDDRCCDTEWDADCAAMAEELCICTPPPFQPVCPDQPEKGDCFTVHGTTGCDASACEATVCTLLPLCCDTLWDVPCVALALVHCACGNPYLPDCTIAHGEPGCNDCNCCTIICDADPFCCESQWDEGCAAAAFFNCATCGSTNSESCCVAHLSPSCNDAECCAAVCSVFIDCCIASWDLDCAILATDLCGQCTQCGNDFAGSCFTPHQLAGCEDVGCCVRVCSLDPYCCGAEWDGFCTAAALSLCIGNSVCADLGFGITCFAEHPEIPGCSEPYCCQAICTLSAACCEVGWDALCVELAFGVCDTCGDPISGSCLDSHANPGCNFRDCCVVVCGSNPSCCETAWDSDCVILATDLCCGLAGTGNCFEADGAPWCDDSNCCETVCAFDRSCCDQSWDSLCAEEALDLCDLPCVMGSPPGIRSCFLSHEYGGCDIVQVCRGVCLVDPYCCEVRWDAVCVEEALSFDAGALYASCPPILGGCFNPHPGPGCTDELCCKAVCSLDSSCCSQVWDVFCAQQAAAICKGGLFPFPPPCPGEGDCHMEQLTPACEDHACCIVVCEIDATCCDNSWDFMCVFFANSLCDQFLPERCIPSGQPCLSVHNDGYCFDVGCSNAVCTFDVLCCEESWDAVCVSTAFALCGVGSGSLLAGECFVPHAIPGCSDWACSERVCYVDPFCCNVVWDSICAILAFDGCKGGSCFAEQDIAGCDSVAIMAKVCGVEEFCCSVEWDLGCVELAQQFFLPPDGMGGPGQCSGSVCVPDCGDPDAGDCFSFKTNPFCEDATCCFSVCDQDQFCCQSTWDDTCILLAKEFCPKLWADEIFPAGDLCAGPCFLIKPLPNCQDEECSLLVCSDIPECCVLAWDSDCVTSALFYCRECGDEDTGDCCFPHGTPYCNDEECCTMVCAIDNFCCSLGGLWDIQCVQLAQGVCERLCPTLDCGDPRTGSCFEPHGTALCDDKECCTFICNFIDPACCDSAWDELCVEQAEKYCSP